MSDRFYITTPIYYPNAEPHLGHVYTTICADVLARYHRAIGEETYFLTGTDEHGIKMVKAAAEKNTSPKELADSNVIVFRELWKELKITNDDFIRTPEERHKATVNEIVNRMLASGDIYLGAYEGWYDEGQEEFVTENDAKDAEYKSKISGRPLVRYKEPTYFFKLAKYVEQVRVLIEKDEIVVRPESRKNEVLSKLKGWDQDLSISRATLKWGIPLPNDPEHVIYVWIDALSNYISALGFGQSDDALFKKYWPVNVHLIGKEILWFHAVYWPAMLLSLGLPTPKKIYAHGWWTADGKKMSKSMGNFIDLEKLRGVIATYSLDALRFYLLRAAPFGNDLDWNDADLVKAYTELGNVVGNLLNRTLKMVGKYREASVPAIGTRDESIDGPLEAAMAKVKTSLADAYEKIELQQAAVIPVELARLVNAYIDTTAPFSLAKDPAKAGRLDTVLNLASQGIYLALVSLLPILPEKAAAGLAQLGVEAKGRTITELLATGLPVGQKLNEGVPLFPRIDLK